MTTVRPENSERIVEGKWRTPGFLQEFALGGCSPGTQIKCALYSPESDAYVKFDGAKNVLKRSNTRQKNQSGSAVYRRDYARAYYARTAARRRKLASHRRQAKRWAAWLLNELFHNWPPEPRAVLAADLRDSLLEYR